MHDNYIEQVAELEKQIFSDSWDISVFEKMKDDSAERLFVAINDDNQLLGYCCLQIVLDEAEVLRIAVAPQHRKRGIGACILKYLISFLAQKGSKTIFLEVRSDNAPAIKLYEAIGFKKLSVRKDYYSKGCDGLIYNYSITY